MINLIKKSFEFKQKVTVSMLCIVIVSLLAVCFSSCRKKCDIEVERPRDIKPIKWDDYNDAYHVFWNIFAPKCNQKTGYKTGKTIKVSGMLVLDSIRSYPSYLLKSEYEYEHNDIYDYMSKIYKYPIPSVKLSIFIGEEFQKKIDSADLTKKCYIKGELATGGVEAMENDICCFTVPHIFLYTIEDIYFEGEKKVKVMNRNQINNLTNN